MVCVQCVRTGRQRCSCRCTAGQQSCHLAVCRWPHVSNSCSMRCCGCFTAAGEFGRGSAMQYGEADLQGRDFAKQVGRVTAKQCTQQHTPSAASKQLTQNRARSLTGQVGVSEAALGVFLYSCSSAHTQGVTSHSLSPPPPHASLCFRAAKKAFCLPTVSTHHLSLPHHSLICPVNTSTPTHPHPARGPHATCAGPAPLQLHICRHPQGQLPGQQPAGRLPDEGGRLQNQL